VNQLPWECANELVESTQAAEQRRDGLDSTAPSPSPADISVSERITWHYTSG